MPDDLKNFISTSATEHQKDNMVWFSCEGENPADIEHIGEIEWYPSPGVPKYFFPYTNQDGYLSPIVFAHFKNPKRKWINSFRKHDLLVDFILCILILLTEGVLISISCKAWAKNIKHDTMERMGLTHFELMID